jgi:8-oxo-dGTP pyrophosphatase MutT (NUDIX family)
MASAGGGVLFYVHPGSSNVTDWHEPSLTGIPIRPTARVLLLDLDNRVLLFRALGHDGLPFWFTPGGGAEPDETPEQAARRELFEETGLSGIDIGPEIWRRTITGPFDGIVREFRERWFFARVPHFELDTRGFDQLERDTITEHRWWALSELDTWHERLVPGDLAARIKRLLRDGPPAAPIDIAR